MHGHQNIGKNEKSVISESFIKTTAISHVTICIFRSFRGRSLLSNLPRGRSNAREQTFGPIHSVGSQSNDMASKPSKKLDNRVTFLASKLHTGFRKGL